MNPYICECKKCHLQYPRPNRSKFICRNCKIESGLLKHEYPRTFFSNRKIAFTRDGNKCQCCGDKKKLLAHHIDCNKLNNSPSNLITLCIQCHFSLHGKYNKETLRRSNIYKLFPKKFRFGIFGKKLIYK